MTLDMIPEQCQTQINRQGLVGCDHIPCASHPERWFCVQTAPQAEIRALSELSQSGFRAHLPQFVGRRTRYGKVEAITRPLFPSYLFVQFDPSDNGWGVICRARGVRRLFTTALGTPLPVRIGEVERLIGLGRAGDGVIDDEADPFPAIAPGQEVRCLDGPFVDWSGVCQWTDRGRVGILMTLFSELRVIPMPRKSVEVVR